VQFSDKNHQMSTDYGVLLPKEGISLRGLFLIDPQGVTRQITINDLPVGPSRLSRCGRGRSRCLETCTSADSLRSRFQFVEKHGEVSGKVAE
jgi:hypothetical protein